MIDEKYLETPAMFKARAYLDSHRGQTIPYKIRRSPKTVVGWKKQLPKLLDATKPIPNRWWGTNCDLNMWEIGVQEKLRPSAFTLWCWLLNQEGDINMSQTLVGELLGWQKSFALSSLIDKRLVLGHRYVGGSTIVYKALRHKLSARAYRNLLAKRAILIEKDGKILKFCGNAAAFAAKHGLDESGVLKLTTGQIAHHRGWRLS